MNIDDREEEEDDTEEEETCFPSHKPGNWHSLLIRVYRFVEAIAQVLRVQRQLVGYYDY